MNKKKVVVFDYGSGNVHSASRALARLGAQVELTSDYQAGLQADGLLVPGVGAYGAVMAEITARRGGLLIEQRLAGGRPVLGICVGLQIMFERGTEHGIETLGLGQWPGSVTALNAPVVPHMGWSKVEAPQNTELFAGVEDQHFYFVHSYAAKIDPASLLPADNHFQPPLTTWAEHGERFVAAVENGPLKATQFHPEKSGEAGFQLLENWLKSL